MPTYEYACKSCGEHLEIVQAFTDDALTTCPTCAGQLRKVYGNIAIAFKGSGFYKTDNRSVGKGGGAPGESKSESAEPKSESEPKAESGAKAESGSKSGSEPANGSTSDSSSSSSPSSPSPARSNGGSQSPAKADTRTKADKSPAAS